MDKREIGAVTNEILATKAGEIFGVSKEKAIPNLDEPLLSVTTNEILATKAGVGKSNIAYLVAVKKARTDLFEQVFLGK